MYSEGLLRSKVRRAWNDCCRRSSSDLVRLEAAGDDGKITGDQEMDVTMSGDLTKHERPTSFTHEIEMSCIFFLTRPFTSLSKFFGFIPTDSNRDVEGSPVQDESFSSRGRRVDRKESEGVFSSAHLCVHTSIRKFRIRFIVQRTVMPNPYDSYLRVKIRFHSLRFLGAFVRVVELPE